MHNDINDEYSTVNIFAALYAAKKTLSSAEASAKSKRASFTDELKAKRDELLIAKEKGIPIIENDDANMPKEGFIVLDFGHRVRFDALIRNDRAILFSFKLQEDEVLSVQLKPKPELQKFLEMKKKDATWENIVEKLNTMVVKNKLELKTGEPFLVASRKKEIDIGLALDNLLKADDPFWGKKLRNLHSDLEELKELDPLSLDFKEKTSVLDAFIEKITANSKESFVDNPYLNMQNGRQTIPKDVEKAFIRELEETNIDLAVKITKEGTGEERFRVLGEYGLSEIATVSKSLEKLLERRYSEKIEFLSTQENEESMTKIINTQIKR